MADQDFTTKEREFNAEVSKTQSILSGLGAIALLMFRANEENEGGYTEEYLSNLFKDCPWIGKGESLDGKLSSSLQEGLAELLLREAGKAWNHVDMASQIIEAGKRGGTLTWLEAPQGKITDTETFKKLEEAAESQITAQNLSDYDPRYANAKVSVLAMWKHLDRLADDLADDPGKVGDWVMKIHDELQQCQVA